MGFKSSESVGVSSWNQKQLIKKKKVFKKKKSHENQNCKFTDI